MTRAWKFLDHRSTGVFSGFVWPTPAEAGRPGPWVESASLVPCEQGIHACSAEHLAWWMSAQLWEIELSGEVIAGDQKVVAERGRLVRLIGGWPDLGAQLAEWAVWRVRDDAVAVLTTVGNTAGATAMAATETFDSLATVAGGLRLEPASPAGIAVEQVVDAIDDVVNPIFACWDAARAAGHRASAIDRSIASYKAAFASERQAQSRRIAERLSLAGEPALDLTAASAEDR